MKHSFLSKVVSVVLTVILLFSMSILPSSATSEELPGSSVTVPTELSEVSNRDLLISL